MRSLRRIILALIILLAGGLGAVVFLLPAYVEYRAIVHLESLGFDVRGFSVAKLSISRATLAGIRLTLPDGDSTLSLNSAEAEFSLSSLLEGKVDRIVLHGADLEIRGPGLHPGGKEVNPTPEDDGGMAIPVRELEISSASIRLRAGSLSASTLLSGRFQWRPEEAVVSGTLQIESSIGGPGDREICRLESADVTAKFVLQRGRTLKDIVIESTVPQLRIFGHPFRNTELEITGDGSRLEWGIRSQGDTFRFDGVRGNYSMDPLNKSLRVDVESPSITNGAFSVSAQEAKFSMGFSTNAAFGDTVSTTIKSPVFLRCPVPDFGGELSYRSGLIDGSLQPAGESMTSDPALSWRVSNRDEPSVVRITSPLLRVDPERSVGSCLQSRFDVQAHADLFLTGLFPLEDVPEAPAVHVDIRNGDFDIGSIEIEGVNGTVELSIRQGIHSRGKQELEVENIKLGRLELHDGRLEFTLESADSILLERMEWSVFGGRMTSLATRFERSNPVTSLDLICEELNLVDVLNVAFGKNFTGSGLLYGRLPIKVRRPPKPGIAFGDGYLFSRPGKGNLGFGTSPEVQSVIEQGILRDRPGLELEEVRRQVSQTLEDFEYNSLILKIGQSPGRRPYGTLDIDGKGAHEHGVPIRFEIRFSVEPL